MNETGKRVLILEHDAETGQLFENVLKSNGYDATWILEATNLVEVVQSRQPDLLIYDLGRESREPYRGLDLLRSDPETSRVPILVTSLSRTDAEAALASYNVRDILVKPFDLDQLITKVRQTLGLQPLQTKLPFGVMTHSLILALGYHILVDHSREAIFCWVQRLQAQPPWRSRTDLHVAALIDTVPLYIEALCCALSCGDVNRMYQCIPDLVPRLRQHALERESAGIAIEFVIREHTILRDEIWATLRRYLPRQLPTDDLLTLERMINGTLDRFLEIAIGAYAAFSSQPSVAATRTQAA